MRGSRRARRLRGLTDPYAGLAPPTTAGQTCLADSHPAATGNTYYPGVYKSTLNVSGTTLSPGIYILCNGFSTSGTTVANGALLYQVGLCTAGVAQPSASATPAPINFGQGDFDASPDTTPGPYIGMVLWQAVSDTVGTTTAASNNVDAQLNGTVYIPGATVNVKKGMSFKALITKELYIQRW